MKFTDIYSNMRTSTDVVFTLVSDSNVVPCLFNSLLYVLAIVCPCTAREDF